MSDRFDFPKGTVETTLNTGTTPIPYNGGTIPAADYPVYTLNPIEFNGKESLRQRLKQVIEHGT